MEDLRMLSGSSLFDKHLYADKKLKFALQIDPAIYYLLKHLVEESNRETAENLNHTNEQLLEITKQERPINEQLIAEIERISLINQEVKKLPSTQDQQELERIRGLLEDADKYMLEIKGIVQEIIAGTAVHLNV